MSYASFADDCYRFSPNDFLTRSLFVEIVSKPKVRFIDSSGKNSRAFLLSGDEVVVDNNSDVGGLICGNYIDQKGRLTAGALRKSDLSYNMFKLPNSVSFVGHWTRGNTVWQHSRGGNELVDGAQIIITNEASSGKLNLIGLAAYQLPEFVSNDSQTLHGHIGRLQNGKNLGFEVNAIGAEIQFSENRKHEVAPFPSDKYTGDIGDCAVKIRLLSRRYLLVEDNNNCGAHNVTFSGLYIKQQ